VKQTHWRKQANEKVTKWNL